MNTSSQYKYEYLVIRIREDGKREVAAWYHTWENARKEARFLNEHDSRNTYKVVENE